MRESALAAEPDSFDGGSVDPSWGGWHVAAKLGERIELRVQR